ncbi:serpin-like protein [Medicago truncatula]|uniref:Serpin-like protein n=2 Tax=Medicago truncatula TaxID=3880 RepID=G7J438_MEDTR|nr:serpin-like protein [Medicago truncatula]
MTNQTRVSLRIAKHLFSKQSENNIVFSPLSLQVVLSILIVPHRTCFSIVLSDAASAGGPHLSFVDGVWIEKTLSLQPSFKQIMSSDYKATLASVDFMFKAPEVRKEVNIWVEKETNGLIKELIPPGSVDSLTSLIFANALYFRGAWNEKFDVSCCSMTQNLMDEEYCC